MAQAVNIPVWCHWGHKNAPAVLAPPEKSQLLAHLRRADRDRESRIIGLQRTRLRWAQTDAIVESPGGISPPGAPRTVHDPLESHGSRCSAVAIERLCLVHRLLLLPVGQWARPNNAAPSLQPHYRAFDATTGCSAPAPRFGTLALAVGAACGLSLHVIGVTKHRFSRSIRKPGRASRRLHAGCRSGSIRASPELIPEEGSPPGSDIA